MTCAISQLSDNIKLNIMCKLGQHRAADALAHFFDRSSGGMLLTMVIQHIILFLICEFQQPDSNKLCPTVKETMK